MNNQGGTPPRKSTGWLVDQILGAFEASGGNPAAAGKSLDRPDVDDLVSRLLDEELERVEEEPVEG
jgi:hypothetical protein